MITTVFNQIHLWNGPTHHPLKRIALTRLSSIACVALETIGIATAMFRATKHFCLTLKYLSLDAVHHISPKFASAFDPVQLQSNTAELKRSLIDLCYRVAGIFLTIFVGIIFSPEFNFRQHLELGLIDDISAMKMEKSKKNEEIYAVNAAIINKQRAERSAAWEAQRQADRESAEQESAVDAHLAEILLGTT